MNKPSLLIVDDEPNIRHILQVAFEKVGYYVRTAENAHDALKTLEESSYDCVLTDVTMPGPSGYELLAIISEKFPQTKVVVMTAFGTIPQAIAAIRNGAYEFVTKPFDLDTLKKVIASAVASEAPSKAAKKKAHSQNAFIAESAPLKEIYEMVSQVADSRATVLITGESGVGKEVVAKALHTLSTRASKPFVAVSCAALPESLLESELFGYEKGAFTGAQGAKEGRFELADKGTLFLDEIGEIPASVQIKLLRVLQERQFERLGSNKPTDIDVRLVTATNRDLHQAVEEGIFRLDLLYRLQVVEIQIPPLRKRQDDVLPLAELFLAKFADRDKRPTLTVSDEALRAMQSYNWPGNVRELENAMERAMALARPDQTELTLQLLPPVMKSAA